MYNRAQYMNGEINYNEYYDQFVTSHVISMLDHKRVKDSECKHFNDINLTYWDRLAAFMPGDVVKEVAKSNASTHGGKPAISLSDCVCVLKAAARRIRGH